MSNTNSPSEAGRRIDLTDGTDVQYWCRIFDVTMEELRQAVHHAGHQPDAVARYLRQKKGRRPVMTGRRRGLEERTR